MPRVSVLMPSYNCAHYVTEAIGSICRQTFTDFELVVLDDASTDDTANVLAGLTDPRIKVVEGSQRRGIAASRNHLVELASSPMIAWMDADDVSVPTRLQQQVDRLIDRPDIAVVGADVITTDQDGNISGKPWVPPTLPDVIEWEFLFGTPLINGTTMVRREVYDQQRYDHKLSVGEDNDLWARCLMNVKMSNLDSVVLLHRRHPGNTTAVELHHSMEIGVLITKRVLSDLMQMEVSLPVCRALRYPHLLEPNMSTASDVVEAMETLAMMVSRFVAIRHPASNETRAIHGSRAVLRVKLWRAHQRLAGDSRAAKRSMVGTADLLRAIRHVAGTRSRAFKERLQLRSEL